MWKVHNESRPDRLDNKTHWHLTLGECERTDLRIELSYLSLNVSLVICEVLLDVTAFVSSHTHVLDYQDYI